jgi:hypothetical protein
MDSESVLLLLGIGMVAGGAAHVTYSLAGTGAACIVVGGFMIIIATVVRNFRKEIRAEHQKKEPELTPVDPSEIDPPIGRPAATVKATT